MLGDTETEKRKFHYSKCQNYINNADIDKIVIFKKVFFDMLKWF